MRCRNNKTMYRLYGYDTRISQCQFFSLQCGILGGFICFALSHTHIHTHSLLYRYGACKSCAAVKRHINWDFLFHLLSLLKWFCMRLYHVLHIYIFFLQKKTTHNVCLSFFGFFFYMCLYIFMAYNLRTASYWNQ